MVKENTLKVGDIVFEIVDFIPLGYEVWNIGHHMPKGWIPLCRLSSHQPFPGGRNIERDTLKAISEEDYKKCMKGEK